MIHFVCGCVIRIFISLTELTKTEESAKYLGERALKSKKVELFFLLFCEHSV